MPRKNKNREEQPIELDEPIVTEPVSTPVEEEPNLFDIVLDGAMKKIRSGDLDEDLILDCIIIVMELVDQYSKNDPVPGPRKKDIVLKVINTIIDEKVKDQDKAVKIKFLVSTLGARFIDNTISASNGKFKFGKKGGCCTIV